MGLGNFSHVVFVLKTIRLPFQNEPVATLTIRDRIIQ